MDLVAEEQRDIIFKEREEDLKRLSLPLNCTAFKTSIWDETLYKAWSNIVCFSSDLMVLLSMFSFELLELIVDSSILIGLHANSKCRST